MPQMTGPLQLLRTIPALNIWLRNKGSAIYELGLNGYWSESFKVR